MTRFWMYYRHTVKLHHDTLCETVVCVPEILYVSSEKAFSWTSLFVSETRSSTGIDLEFFIYNIERC